MAQRPPTPPTGLRRSGRALWRAVVTDYVLDEHENAVLKEACRTADTLDDLQALLKAEGLTSESSQGVRVHPALVELRQQRIVFARLLAALRIPAGDSEGSADREQVRGTPRGVYGIAGGGLVRRRTPQADSPTPSRLLRYDRADWEGVGCHPECAYWAAVEQWRAETETEDAALMEIEGGGPDEPWHPERI